MCVGRQCSNLRTRRRSLLCVATHSCGFLHHPLGSISPETDHGAFVSADRASGRFRRTPRRRCVSAPGSIVELRRFDDAKGQRRVAMAVRSDFTIEQQITAKGATWLDRQAIAREPIALGGGGVRCWRYQQRIALASGRFAMIDDGLWLPARSLVAITRKTARPSCIRPRPKRRRHRLELRPQAGARLVSTVLH